MGCVSCTMTLRDAMQALADGSVSSVALCQAYLDRIAAVEPKVGALLAINPDFVLQQAKASDERRAAGKPLSAFDGIPVTLKDNISSQGEQCSCASKILKGFVSPYDSFVVQKLKSAGCVLMGRANMDEFAMGSSCENSAYQKTSNPWNLKCVPGGSSGGSAAAVAACETVAALGSDTGGSIRQPAAFCGVVGLKPTYGRVSRNGLVAFASSLDQIGPFTRTVWDSAALFTLIAGQDDKDSTSLPQEKFDFAADLSEVEANPSLQGMKIGLPKEYYEVEGLDASVKSVMDKTIVTFKKLGAEFVDVSLPHTKYAMACYYIIATAEASANLARFDGIRYGYRSADAADINSTYENSRGEGFGPEVLRRIMLGTYVLSSGYYDAYYLQAQKVRTLLRDDFRNAYKSCDIILTPVTPAPAFEFGAKADPLQMYLSDIFTTALNLSGDCGISIPSDVDPATGLPIGIQLIAPSLEEKRLFRAGRAFELARERKDWIAPLA